ncbi:MAG: aldo/keto reductase [Parvibaculaceae bacterium]
MKSRRLGRSGLLVPPLSLGTATFGGGDAFFRAWGATDANGATRLLDIALDAGITLFDCADSYSRGLAEEILGKAMSGRRDKVLVSTKASFRTGDGPNDVGSSRAHLITACEASLRRLGTNYIDLWQMHGFDPMTPVEETLDALDMLVRAGKVRYVGCSNFSGWHLMKSLGLADRNSRPRYVAHQAYYSLLAREFEWELMPLALEEGVGTVVWSPLAGGLLSGKFGRGRPTPEGSRSQALGSLPSRMPKERFYALVETLEAIAGETGCSVSQVALNWVMQRPTVATVIMGARDEAQLRANLGAGDFALDTGQMRRLDDASAEPPTYPYWHQWTVYAERNTPPVPQAGLRHRD